MDIIAEAKKLNFPPDKYVVFAGAALAARGLKETHDLDIIVAHDLLGSLKGKDGWEDHPRIDLDEPWGLHRGDVELYPTVGAGVKLTFEELRARAELIDDVPVCSLMDLITIKQAYGREKDLVDIERIKAHLAAG